MRNSHDCMAELEAPLDELLCFYGVGNHGGALHRRAERALEPVERPVGAHGSARCPLLRSLWAR